MVITPEFECSVKRAGSDGSPVRRHVAAGQLVVVALQRGQRQPGLGRPEPRRVVVRGGDQELARGLLEPHVGHEVGVGGDGVLDVALPEISAVKRSIGSTTGCTITEKAPPG